MPHSPQSYLSLHGKTCLVTGATSGIGLVTAAALAGLGARVAFPPAAGIPPGAAPDRV